MKKFNKILASAVSLSLASTLTACSPSVSIGKDTTVAMTIDGYEVPAGLFIYYTIQGYSEAENIVQGEDGGSPTASELKNANIDSLSSTDWIQNKAVDYCIDYVSIVKEFDEIGGTLSPEDVDSAKSMAEYYYNQDDTAKNNGISLKTMEDMAKMQYMQDAIFNHYYGFDGVMGYTEEDLKEYFLENFARVKYVSISLLDNEGEPLGEDEQRELRKLAEGYAKQVNEKSSEIERMHELDAVQEQYDEYLAAKTTSAEDEMLTTTTTTTTVAPDETTTTTTTNPYLNEKLIQNTTTTAKSEDTSTENTETETVEETDKEKETRLFKEFLFGDLPLGEAKVYDYNKDTIYVVMRGDLSVRLTDDDYWSQSYIDSLQQTRYMNDFVDMMQEKADKLTPEKNAKAFRRYEPFKLELERD